MRSEYAHGFLQGCHGRPGVNKQTWLDRLRLLRRRRRQDDLAGLKGRWGL